MGRPQSTIIFMLLLGDVTDVAEASQNGTRVVHLPDALSATCYLRALLVDFFFFSSEHFGSEQLWMKQNNISSTSR